MEPDSPEPVKPEGRPGDWGAWGAPSGEQGPGLGAEPPPSLGVLAWVLLWVGSGLTVSTLGLSLSAMAQVLGGTE